MDPYWRATQLADDLFRVTENDPYGQFPFLYVFVGTDKIVILDSGCGICYKNPNYFYRDWLDEHINKKKLPYVVICTHVHFDHVGSNHRFSGDHKEGVKEIIMGSAHEVFSRNLEINSLAMAHAHKGCKIVPFDVTLWAQDGHLVYLDDENKSEDNALRILHTPGHTPDSISLYSRKHRRLFVGDNLYPYTAIHMDCIGSDVASYRLSLIKMQAFVTDEQKLLDERSKEQPVVIEDDSKQNKPIDVTAIDNDESEKPVQEEAKIVVNPHQALIDEFFVFTELSMDKIEKKWSIESLIQICNENVMEMVTFYFGNADIMPQICPPRVSLRPNIGHRPKDSGMCAIKTGIPIGNGEIVLSCGHVEDNLPVSNITGMLQLLEVIQAGVLPPTRVDDGYGEYTNGQLTVMMPLKPKWETN